MKKIAIAAVVGLAVVLGGVTLHGSEAIGDERSGEDLFKQNCAVCHKDGGNIVNPKKTLREKDRVANNVKTADDIVNRMRNPGPGMTKFDAKTVSDKDAHKIAEYILKTFK